jgi:hypothetical protein
LLLLKTHSKQTSLIPRLACKGIDVAWLKVLWLALHIPCLAAIKMLKKNDPWDVAVALYNATIVIKSAILSAAL